MSLNHLSEELKKKVQSQVSLKLYNTWRIGGSADYWMPVTSIHDLSMMLMSIPVTLPVHCLGLGSNVLIRDSGVSGLVFSFHPHMNRWAQQDDHKIWVEAGMPCPKLARLTARLGFADLEFLCGVPGTIGGALMMNAGCWGQSIWSHVLEVQTIDRQGHLHRRTPQDYWIRYREVQSKCAVHEWFYAATLSVSSGQSSKSLTRIRELIQERTQKQPHEPSCGSVFINPEPLFAAKLIENSGLKGFRVGGCVVSEKHANFMVNDDSAKSSDAENLMVNVMHIVYARCGIWLQPEVKILGSSSPFCADSRIISSDHQTT